MNYVQQHYGVPAEIGRRVIAYGKPGIIAEDRGHYIGVNLDEDSPSVIKNYHPVDGIEYLGMGEIRKLTGTKKKIKSKERYQRYLRTDCFESFIQFCYYDAKKYKQYGI